MRRTALVTNIPNPYRIPLFNEMDHQLIKKGYSLNVIFGARKYSRRRWDIRTSDCRFNFSILKSTKIRLGDAEKIMFLYNGLMKEILRLKPEIVIVGGFSLATLKIWILSHFLPLKYIIWSGSTRTPGRTTSFLREWFRKLLMKRSTAYVAYGSRARDYLVSLGANPDDVKIGINTVDTGFFAKKTAEVRNHIKRKKGERHLTYIGYLVPRKKTIRVLEAVRALIKDRTDFILDIVGDGKDKISLQKFAENENIDKHVAFHGFVPKEDIPNFLAVSDCLLFQTEFDIWGLVLNEAMSAGIPCLASINAGATDDLIKDGVTGFVCDFRDADKTSEKISWILDHKEEMNVLGQNAAEFIASHCSLSHSASGFVSAVEGASKLSD